MTLSEQRQSRMAKAFKGSTLFEREATWRFAHNQRPSPTDAPGSGKAARILRGQLRRTGKARAPRPRRPKIMTRRKARRG